MPMRDSIHSDTATAVTSQTKSSLVNGGSATLEPVIQVICVGSGGGPTEDNVTAFLARSISTKWSKNSVLALDAGSHLGALTRMLQQHFPLYADAKTTHHSSGNHSRGNGSTPSHLVEDYEMTDSSGFTTPEPQFTTLQSGPFAGLPFPYESARANALHIVHECISTYLISHPHLDHLSAFAINTAAFHNTSRPKRLAALPSTVNAIKTHIFNDIIWPNLTDEDGGVGFVTFQRLAQGGNLAVGSGPGKGYMEVCDGLCVKGMKVSHGRCIAGPLSNIKRGSDVGLSEATVPAQDDDTPAALNRRMSFAVMGGIPLANTNSAASPPSSHVHREAVVDSTAFFVRDDRSGREILFFGDVEPDSISLNPRTAHVWAEAAPKVASGKLKAVFIECSYDDSQSDNLLFGHMAPRHLFLELQSLANLVIPRRSEYRERRESRKRKREALGLMVKRTDSFDNSPFQSGDDEPPSRPGVLKKRTSGPVNTIKNSNSTSGFLKPSITFNDPMDPLDGAATPMPLVDIDREPPLTGLTVVIIHVKDTMRDGPVVGDRILEQLQQHDSDLIDEDGVGLGCKFLVSKVGEEYAF